MRCVVEMGGLYEVCDGDVRPLGVEIGSLYEVCGGDVGGLHGMSGGDGRPL